MREDKRIKCRRKPFYPSNVCLECERILRREYTQSKKNDPEFKKHHAKRAREFYHKNKEKIKVYAKERRQKPEYKKYVYDYYRNNKDKILKQHKPVNKKHLQKLLTGLSPKYAQRLRNTAKYQIKSNKSKTKNSNYINMTDSEILLQVAKVRLKKLLKEAYGK